MEALVVDLLGMTKPCMVGGCAFVFINQDLTIIVRRSIGFDMDANTIYIFPTMIFYISANPSKSSSRCSIRNLSILTSPIQGDVITLNCFIFNRQWKNYKILRQRFKSIIAVFFKLK